MFNRKTEIIFQCTQCIQLLHTDLHPAHSGTTDVYRNRVRLTVITMIRYLCNLNNSCIYSQLCSSIHVKMRKYDTHYLSSCTFSVRPLSIVSHLALFQLAWNKSWRKNGSRILSSFQLNWIAVKTKNRIEFTHPRKISRKYDRHHAPCTVDDSLSVIRRR